MTSATLNTTVANLTAAELEALTRAALVSLARQHNVTVSVANAAVEKAIATKSTESAPTTNPDKESTMTPDTTAITLEDITPANTVRNQPFEFVANGLALKGRVVLTRGALGKSGKGTCYVGVRPSNWNRKVITVKLYGENHRQDLHIAAAYANAITTLYSGGYETVTSNLVIKSSMSKFVATMATAHRQGYVRIIDGEVLPAMISVPGEYDITVAQREEYRASKVVAGALYTINVDGGRIVLGQRINMPVGIEWLVRSQDGQVVLDDQGHASVDEAAVYSARTVQKAAFVMGIARGYEYRFQLEQEHGKYIADLFTMTPEQAGDEIARRMGDFMARKVEVAGYKNVAKALASSHDSEELLAMGANGVLRVFEKVGALSSAVDMTVSAIIAGGAVKFVYVDRAGQIAVPGSFVLGEKNAATVVANCAQKGHGIIVKGVLATK